MLQQTRVDTVLRYYERFLDRFPDANSLGQADHDEVLKHWEGLGYYRRVLNLHRAARALVEEGEDLPRTAAGLRRLQGVGDYTAAAIASIAYGERVAAVDGNVARVIARLFHIEEDILTVTAKARIGAIAGKLVPADRPGAFNQAWMDFANVVCLPRNPHCTECPLRSRCEAHARGAAGRIPARGGANGRAVPTVRLVVILIARRGRLLVRKRARGGLWSGMWELPHREFMGNHPHAAIRHLAGELGLKRAAVSETLADIEHRLTHRHLRFRPVVVDADSGNAIGNWTEVRWVSRRGLADLPIPTAFRKVLRAAGWDPE